MAPTRLGRVVVVQHLRLLLLVVALALAPDPVDGLAVGGGGQPGAGVGRYAVGRPPLDGGRERLGRRLLGDVEVAEAPGQGGDHPRPLLVVGPGDRLADVDHVTPTRNGRTSTLRLQAFDPSAASLSATSRSGASMIQKPARYSFDSRNGPSVKIGSLAAVVDHGGRARATPRPPANTQWPSARSRSLNASMAAISSGVARAGRCRRSRKPGTASRIISCVGRPRAAAHPCYEQICPNPTPPPGFFFD